MTDIDECSSGSVGMEVCNNVSVCVNTLGSYLCSCYRGYTTASDGVTCVGMYAREHCQFQLRKNKEKSKY